MKYNPEIHHRRSIRIKNYDYSQAGIYFIMICTWNKKCIFGTIENGEMKLNEYGRIVENEWNQTGKIRLNIHVDAYITMPNHFHGIIQINKNNDARLQCASGTKHCAPTVEYFGKPTSNTIPSIIRGLKSSVTNQINKIRKQPGVPVWQRNYYEHIIRDEKSYQQICEYIQNNPLKWQDDKYYV